MIESNHTNKIKAIECIFWGLKSFSEINDLQLDLVEKLKQGDDPRILYGHHPLTYTIGRRGDRVASLKINKLFYLQNSEIIPVVTDRGGLLTAHSPGQLVIYPLLDLSRLNMGVREYICVLLKVTQDLLRELEIDTTLNVDSDPGVYTSKGKIGFCGIKVERYLTRHGLSLNVFNDLSTLNRIDSCGIKGRIHDSIQNHMFQKLDEPKLESLGSRWCDLFKEQILKLNR